MLAMDIVASMAVFRLAGAGVEDGLVGEEVDSCCVLAAISSLVKFLPRFRFVPSTTLGFFFFFLVVLEVEGGVMEGAVARELEGPMMTGLTGLLFVECSFATRSSLSESAIIVASNLLKEQEVDNSVLVLIIVINKNHQKRMANHHGWIKT
jgi:hypothetical protein